MNIITYHLGIEFNNGMFQTKLFDPNESYDPWTLPSCTRYFTKITIVLLVIKPPRSSYMIMLSLILYMSSKNLTSTLIFKITLTTWVCCTLALGEKTPNTRPLCNVARIYMRQYLYWILPCTYLNQSILLFLNLPSNCH